MDTFESVLAMMLTGVTGLILALMILYLTFRIGDWYDRQPGPTRRREQQRIRESQRKANKVFAKAERAMEKAARKHGRGATWKFW